MEQGVSEMDQRAHTEAKEWRAPTEAKEWRVHPEAKEQRALAGAQKQIGFKTGTIKPAVFSKQVTQVQVQ